MTSQHTYRTVDLNGTRYQFFCDVAFVNEIMVWQKPFSLTELLSFLQ
jgi:hypothetical protein